MLKFETRKAARRAKNDYSDYNVEGAGLRIHCERAITRDTNSPLRLITLRYESRYAGPRSHTQQESRRARANSGPTRRQRAAHVEESHEALRPGIYVSTYRRAPLFIFVRCISRTPETVPRRSDLGRVTARVCTRAPAVMIYRGALRRARGCIRARAVVAPVAIVPAGLVNRHVEDHLRALLHFSFFL